MTELTSKISLIDVLDFEMELFFARMLFSVDKTFMLKYQIFSQKLEDQYIKNQGI